MMPAGPLVQAHQSLPGLLLLVCYLLSPGSQGQLSPLRVEPRDPVVFTGEAVTVNCSADCPDARNVVLETELLKEPVGRGPSWVAFRLSNVTADKEILCAGFCNGSQVILSTNITVYEFPERVELAPLPAWQPVGDNLTLRCEVTGGAPRAHLSVLLLRGEQELGRQPTLGLGEPTRASFTVRARREDHGANFSCRAQLDLRSRGLALFQNSSTSRQLRTFALPRTRPILTGPRILEVGRESTVTCTLEGVFPVWEAQVYMALGDQILNPNIMSRGDTLEATATATALEAQEDAQMACNVTLGGASREILENVTLYSFWGPILNLSNATAREGTTVNVTCVAGHRVQVTLDGAPIRAMGVPAQLRLTAMESDDGRNFSCQARLQVGGETLLKNRSVQLHVLYGPKIDGTQCPQHVTWKVRSRQVLWCQARGNPAPTLQCLQESSSLRVPVGIPITVKSKHKGTYQCQAVSALGKTTMKVVLEVHDGKASSVTIALVVLVVLGLVTISAALLYIYCGKKQSGIYHVRQGGTSLPLTSRQPQRLAEEETS
ncbi:intercellular adhesion molecule 3 [Tenrec ecaudatus]|uniref:intercellular adhesion molecule 3 n=1 Tax=Tenrec ecaudatus TaxID=94439 RepID=UPI003F5A4B6D